MIPRWIVRRLVSQGGRPRGVVGAATAWTMAHRPSNVLRSLWVVSLLAPGPDDRVLEVGFGPGVAIAALAKRAGHVYGIDHSALMVRRARRRNAAAVRAGRVELWQASVAEPPRFGAPLDAIVAVNTLGHWPAPEERLVELRGLLRPGGRIAVVSQPRCPGATAETTARAAAKLTELLTGAGFTDVRMETLDLEPPAACALATNP